MSLAVPPVKRDRGPAHAQIRSWLTEAIARGRLAPGERLPPERDLAARLGVSRMTLRQALAALERDGALVRRVGRDGGTFVAERRLELEGLAALSDQLRRLGLAAGARVLSARERAAIEEERELGERVFEVVRVRLVDGRPVALERTALSASAFPHLLDHPLEGSLYALLRSRYGQAPVRAVERLEPVLAGPEQAEALGVEVGAPLFRVERLAYGRSGRALERSVDHFRGDRVRVVWETAITPPP